MPRSYWFPPSPHRGFNGNFLATTFCGWPLPGTGSQSVLAIQTCARDGRAHRARCPGVVPVNSWASYWSGALVVWRLCARAFVCRPVPALAHSGGGGGVGDGSDRRPGRRFARRQTVHVPVHGYLHARTSACTGTGMPYVNSVKHTFLLRTRGGITWTGRAKWNGNVCLDTRVRTVLRRPVIRGYRGKTRYVWSREEDFRRPGENNTTPPRTNTKFDGVVGSAVPLSAFTTPHSFRMTNILFYTFVFSFNNCWITILDKTLRVSEIMFVDF